MSTCFVLAAGGTGGHVYPALAVAEELRRQRPEAHIHFMGGRRGIEGDLVPKARFPLIRLPAAGLRGLGPLGVLRFSLAFGLGLVAAVAVLLRLRPALVLATGGYASAAPAMAAALLGRPLWLQEQNSVPGSTNRQLARFAERIYVAFDEAREAFTGARRVERAPNPVRASIRAAADRKVEDSDYRRFDLSPRRPTLLVFGGSRGAATLARVLRETWPRICAESEWQVLAQTPGEDLESTRAVVESRDGDASRARVLSYIDDMAAAYRIADLVLCRAGALTLAELTTLGKPSILVPFPHATDDHQTRNARALERAGAAQCIADRELDAATLMDALLQLEPRNERLRRMAEAAHRFAGGEDGAVEIARAMIERSDGRRST